MHIAAHCTCAAAPSGTKASCGGMAPPRLNGCQAWAAAFLCATQHLSRPDALKSFTGGAGHQRRSLAVHMASALPYACRSSRLLRQPMPTPKHSTAGRALPGSGRTRYCRGAQEGAAGTAEGCGVCTMRCRAGNQAQLAPAAPSWHSASTASAARKRRGSHVGQNQHRPRRRVHLARRAALQQRHGLGRAMSRGKAGVAPAGRR